MEGKKKCASCRLAVHHESGRVRWCIGQERQWQTQLKRLVFVPIILLTFVIVTVLLTKFVIDNNTKTNLNNLTMIQREKRDDHEEYYNPIVEQNFIDYFDTFDFIDKGSIELSSYFENEALISNNDKLLKRIKKHVNLDNQIINQTNYTKATKSVTEINNDKYSHLNLLDKDTSMKEDIRPVFWQNQKNYSEIRKLQSKIMQKYMNQNVDPCHDFYEFSCGNWKKYYAIPPDRATYDTFEMVRENLDHALRDLLQDESSINVSKLKSSPSQDATLKVKQLFQSCMQEDLIVSRGDGPLKKIISELGEWPIISQNWNESNFNVIWTLGNLRLYNNDVLISQWVGPDMKNSNEYIIHLDQSSLGLPARDYYLEEANAKYVKAYKAFILNVATLLGTKYEDAKQDVEDIVQFESQVAKIMASTEERRNISDIYLRTNLASLSIYFPQFDWKVYFTTILNKEIDPQTPVACYCAKYLHKLTYLLKTTKPRTIQNYLLWRFIRHRTNNLDDRFMEAKQRFYYVLFGREKQPPRWQFCVSQVNSNMGMALGSLFVKKYFNKISRTDTIEMTERLEKAFEETIIENTWLDNHTKNYARMKINEMDLKIGYPDFILNKTELSQIYDDVKIHPDYFFENILNILRYITRKEQGRIGTAVNRTIWSTPPAVVNAYYSRNKNQIMFPAGMLQPPFYHRHFPKALNFGGIGVVIGHEITHGFDDKGRLFDHHGNLHMWWHKDSIDKFYEKSQCMIDQYSQYVLPEIQMTLDGYLTQGENIADNGGLKQSYRAYETWLENNSDAEEAMPGLNFTGKQLFFLNFAQVWCGQLRSEAAKSRLKTSVHAPGIFRVIGVLSNSEEFSRAFNCPIHSPMNPEYKCTIW